MPQHSPEYLIKKSVVRYIDEYKCPMIINHPYTHTHMHSHAVIVSLMLEASGLTELQNAEHPNNEPEGECSAKL